MRNSAIRLRFSLYGLMLGALLITGHSLYAQEQGPPPPDGMEASQGGPPPRMNVDKQLARMTKRYALSDAQQTQIRPILTEENQKREALFQNTSLPREERFNKMKALHDDETARISAVLTDSQRAKYEKDQERMANHQREGNDSGEPPPPPPGDGGGGPPPAQ